MLRDIFGGPSRESGGGGRDEGRGTGRDGEKMLPTNGDLVLSILSEQHYPSIQLTVVNEVKPQGSNTEVPGQERTRAHLVDALSLQLESGNRSGPEFQLSAAHSLPNAQTQITTPEIGPVSWQRWGSTGEVMANAWKNLDHSPCLPRACRNHASIIDFSLCLSSCGRLPISLSSSTFSCSQSFAISANQVQPLSSNESENNP